MPRQRYFLPLALALASSTTMTRSASTLTLKNSVCFWETSFGILRERTFGTGLQRRQQQQQCIGGTASSYYQKARSQRSIITGATTTLAFCAPYCLANSWTRHSLQARQKRTLTQRYLSSSSSSLSSSEALDRIVKRLVQSQFHNVIVLMGAGASVSAGIPDFRSPGTGLYDQLQRYNLPYPEAIFDLDYYQNVSPKPFCDLAREIWPDNPKITRSNTTDQNTTTTTTSRHVPKPTLTHYFLHVLEQKGILRRVYTQNIDGLEALANVSESKLVECHGHFRSATCTNCQAPMDVSECYQHMVQKGIPPTCRVCGGIGKPDIVFFGESLPERFFQAIDTDMKKCDLLLVIGTSLQVQPVASIPSWIPNHVPRILLNREMVGDFSITTNGENFRDDVFLPGECDDSVRKLCQLLGWEQELDSCLHTN